jgi:predicted transcriptional regulator of viral defense system
VYRFRDYPSTPREEVVAAWLVVGKDSAVVSHESALDLWDLSDVIPNSVQLTVPRARRHLPRLAGVNIHTTTYPLDSASVRSLDGVRITTPLRSLLDAAEAGIAPDQVSLAISQALSRGWIDRDSLRSGAASRGRRVAHLVEDALSVASTRYQELE